MFSSQFFNTGLLILFTGKNYEFNEEFYEHTGVLIIKIMQLNIWLPLMIDFSIKLFLTWSFRWMDRGICKEEKTKLTTI